MCNLKKTIVFWSGEYWNSNNGDDFQSTNTGIGCYSHKGVLPSILKMGSCCSKSNTNSVLKEQGSLETGNEGEIPFFETGNHHHEHNVMV